MTPPTDEKTPAQPEQSSDPRDAPSSDSFEKDIALDLVGEHAQEIDPEVEATVVRKIDLFLMPAMIVGSSHLSLLFPFPLHSVKSPNKCITW